MNDVAKAPTKAPVNTLKALLPFLKPYRARIALALGLLTVASASLLAVPVAFRDLIDVGFVKTAAGSNINAHFLALFGIAAFWAAAVGARFYLVSWLGERVTADLRRAVYARVLRQSPQFFETLQSGEVLSRLTGDTTLVQTVVGSSISMGLRSAFQFVGGMGMLAYTSFHLFAINIGVLALVVLPLILTGRHVRKLSRDTQDRVADASALAGEILNAAPTVQAYTHEHLEAERFGGLVERSFGAAMKRTRMRSGLTIFAITAVFGAIVFVLWLGARDVIAGEMTAGALASFVLYAGLAAGSVGVLAEVWGDMQRAAGATDRLMELLHAQSTIAEPVNPAPMPRSATGGPLEVNFDAVEFHYPSRPATAALDHLTLTIAAGETVALVGPSGAGKTTVFQLLMRFYDATGGAIRIGGTDIRQLALHDLRGAIAIVPQDAVIFSADAMENIRYGRPDATDDEVLAAARAALADEFIARLPEAYATFLGERGVRLSGGQRQRIAIARAILKNAPILLLDEATSALDAESERLVQQGLATAMQGRTTLVIAHRLSTVRHVDRIVLLEHGRVAEQGSPAELLAAGGRFSQLAQLQWVDAPDA
jgi:ATP-binding cassette subfamily B protein